MMLFLLLCNAQITACEEDIDRFQASRAAAQAEAEEADAAAQQALETGHAEVSISVLSMPCTATTYLQYIQFNMLCWATSSAMTVHTHVM